MNYLTKILIAWLTGFVIFGLVVVLIGLLVGSVIDAITFLFLILSHSNYYSSSRNITMVSFKMANGLILNDHE